ncbi:secretory carrier-associated membrane protein 5-like [Oscarella lobularis]|uniref:secretory carrier-associated membrane protein 5-like n=1 Tax=Oscarella lobularis TaxID=121494 RepID=UPI00331406CD
MSKSEDSKSKASKDESLPKPPPFSNEGDEEGLVNRYSQKSGGESDEGEAELVPVQFADRKNNFPPFPNCCPCKPCFYHNIGVDIPPGSQSKTRTLCVFYVVNIVVLFLNLIACLAAFTTGNDGVSFGLSLAWFVLWTPMAFLCWYWPVYKAFRSDSSMWFMFFFFIFFVQIAACIVSAVGIAKSGYSGFIYAISVFTNKDKTSHTAVGAICLIVASLWTLLALTGIVLLLVVHRHYRSSGLSVAQAKGELKEKKMKDLASNA